MTMTSSVAGDSTSKDKVQVIPSEEEFSTQQSLLQDEKSVQVVHNEASLNHGSNQSNTSRQDAVSLLGIHAVGMNEEVSHTGSLSDEILPRTTYRPRSATFDTRSESEYSFEEHDRPIVGRASSVRVGKPRIVQHRSHSNTQVPKIQGDGLTQPDSHSSARVECVSGLSTDMLPIMLEEDTQKPSKDDIAPIGVEDPHNEQQFTSSTQSSRSVTLRPPTEQEWIGLPTHNELGFAHHPSTGNTLNTIQSVHPTIVNPPTPLISELRESDVVNAMPEENHDRALSVQFPVSKGLGRRVTIRPADLIINRLDTTTSFRESIVTTPYPQRRASDQTSVNSDSHCDRNNSNSSSDDTKRANQAKDRRSRVVSFTQLSAPDGVSRSIGEKDRFPSPERPEILFVDLSLLNHPLARTTIEIQITDKSTFDDELLFHEIRKAYSRQLLGLRRLLFTLVRQVEYATVTSPIDYNDTDFDNISFVQHFHKPSLGRKRKEWVIWLRNNNPRHAAPTTTVSAISPRNSGNTNCIKKDGAPIRHIDSLKRLSSHTHSTHHSRASSNNKSLHTDRDINNADPTKRFSTASDASSFNFIYSPAIPRLPLLNSRHENHPVLTSSHTNSPTALTAAAATLHNSASPCRSFFWPNSLYSASRHSASGSNSSNESQTKIVTISFHHRYRIGMIAVLTLLNILSALFAAMIWVFFGVPGIRPGMDKHVAQRVGQHDGSGVWQADARARVLTGAVIGIVVLLIGTIGEGGLIWGARLIL